MCDIPIGMCWQTCWKLWDVLTWACLYVHVKASEYRQHDVCSFECQKNNELVCSTYFSVPGESSLIDGWTVMSVLVWMKCDSHVTYQSLMYYACVLLLLYVRHVWLTSFYMHVACRGENQVWSPHAKRQIFAGWTDFCGSCVVYCKAEFLPSTLWATLT